LDVDGWVDVGLIVFVGFITYHHVGANTRVSADVQSRSMSSLPHGSRTLLRCLDRNVSCGGYECEVISGCT
jgi:hypothetical protein